MRKLALILGLVALLNTGCAVNRATGSVDPSANLLSLKVMYVKKNPDESGNTHELIAEKLRTKGVSVTAGEVPPPSNIDAVVTFVEKWFWDITMYMLELTIVIRDPKTDFPLATGNSYHTSLTRLSPQEMVSEVIDNIYKQAR